MELMWSPNFEKKLPETCCNPATVVVICSVKLYINDPMIPNNLASSYCLGTRDFIDRLGKSCTQTWVKRTDETGHV